MSDLTNAHMSRIRHKIDARRSRRRRSEAIFLASGLVILALIGGYIFGVTKKVRAFEVPAWAEKLGKERAKLIGK